MNSPFSVDLISDLNLTDHDIFDWVGKPTSLFCIVAGNISSDLKVVRRVLEHLGDQYRGVFFIDGNLEHSELHKYEDRVREIKKICSEIEPIIYLHNHVIILDGYAFVGCNGWYGNKDTTNPTDKAYIEEYRLDDLSYLTNSIKKLQNYEEVKSIIIVTNSIPTEYLSYNSPNVKFPERLGPGLSLLTDSDHKVTHWLFGCEAIDIDTKINDRHYVNNASHSGRPYWPKRIVISQ